MGRVIYSRLVQVKVYMPNATIIKCGGMFSLERAERKLIIHYLISAYDKGWITQEPDEAKVSRPVL